VVQGERPDPVATARGSVTQRWKLTLFAALADLGQEIADNADFEEMQIGFADESYGTASGSDRIMNSSAARCY